VDWMIFDSVLDVVFTASEQTAAKVNFIESGD
jgi:hypothetical protein